MHETPCEALKECSRETSDRLERVEEALMHIDNNVKATREIVEIFNDTKGFVNTVKTMSKIAIWFGVTTAALTGIYHTIKNYNPFGD